MNTYLLQCPICNYQGYNFKIFESDCIFIPIEGIDQHLIRHQCPYCDVIFGTQQMLKLTTEKLGEAYKKLFDSGYRDGNEITTNYELVNLLTLQIFCSNTNGVYINWGAGTSVAADKAKLLGYTLFNFDPFVVGDLPPSYITMDRINTMKFDGIISHNLLEHLQDPISELKLMKSLLKPGANMIHSTACYKYSYEYTKYHLFFFEGKSLGVICDKAGLNYEHIGPFIVKYSAKI